MDNWLDRPVDVLHDHVLGPTGAEITLVEYGSYACAHCREANERIAQVRDRLGDRLRYVFRHRPLTSSELARRAAELVERAKSPEQFWKAHVALMTRSATLTEDDLRSVANDLGLADATPGQAQEGAARAKEHVEADEASARRSGANITPTFFINGRRYDGPWDESSFADVLLGSLGHRVGAAALDFASWAPSAGVLLLAASILAVALTNSTWGSAFVAFWQQPWGLTAGDSSFLLPVISWINDGLLSVFFLVVGLEIKREFTVGHLATRQSAALPIAAAIGGMVAPALIYAVLIPAGPWSRGWGVPMATDTAFAVALIIMMGRRVPLELRIFLTAAAIVDDIGAITVVALFYSGMLHLTYLCAAAGLVGALALLNRSRVYRITPYVIVGTALWFCMHAAGVDATLAGVILALFIPTRPPPNLNALVTQASAIIESEAQHEDEVLRHGPSLPAMRALDAIHDRLESPADRLLRQVAPRSSYLVLPLFAFANAGVALSPHVVGGHGPLILAIMCALLVGKPAGLMIASVVAVRLGLATKPEEYSWRQLAGAGALAGIGFTMSLFIATQALPDPAGFAAAKIAVFAGSVLSAAAGVAILWNADRKAPRAAALPQMSCAAEAPPVKVESRIAVSS
ncbi:MAG TPA: Na+/H+ antiporter NhaA [Steroidobacteraceae bacterium]|nr:Na+/H+ antiporter NhaA [Steroidobacteraceae bacterium]